MTSKTACCGRAREICAALNRRRNHRDGWAPLVADPDDYGGGAGNGKALRAPGAAAQFLTLLSRAWRLQFRATDARKADLVKNCMVGLMAATVFNGQGDLQPQDPLIEPATGEPTAAAANALSLFYFGVMYGTTGHMQAIPAMFLGKEVFCRERDAGLYGAAAHWLAQAVAPLAPLTVSYLVYVNIAYWATGMPAEADKYACFLLINFVAMLVGYAAAQAFAAASPTPQLAFSLWPMFFILFSNFAGYGVRVPNVARWWHWLCDVSFCRWLFQAVANNAVQGFGEEHELRKLYGFNSRGKWASLAFCALWYLGINLVTLLALRPPPDRLAAVSEIPDEDTLQDGTWREQAATEATALAASPASSESDGGSSKLNGVSSDVNNVSSDFNNRESSNFNFKVLLEDENERLLEAPDGTLYLTDDGDGRNGGRRDDDSATAPLLPKATPAAATAPGSDKSRKGTRPAGGFAAPADFASEELRAKGCTVLFKDLSYRVRPARGSPALAVLTGVSGKAEPGRLFAILGPSGAGKSTLLDVLAGRKKTTGKLTGTVLFDGQKPGPEMTSRRAFVAQDNVHIASITVRQTLEFAAALRVPGFNAAARRARAERVDLLLGVLGLTAVQGSKVGSTESRGISGGELRRLSIAVEVAGLPDVIFLDEPTSGLDSTTALAVMTACRSLATQGRTVVCAVHQPAPAVFALFDDLLLLARGRGIYFGPAGGAAEHFASLSFLPASVAAEAAKPAGEFIMAVAAAATTATVPAGGADADTTTILAAGGDSSGSDLEALLLVSEEKEAEEEESNGGSGSIDVLRLLRAFQSTAAWHSFDAAAAEEMRAADTGSARGKSGSKFCRGGGGRRHPTPVWWQAIVLTRRHALKTLGDSKMLVASLVRHVFVAVLYGTLWFGLEDSQLYERLSLLFFSLVFIMLGNQQSIPGVFQDRLLFYRERSAGVTATSAFWAAVSVAGILQLLVNSLVYSVIVYTMAGLNQDGQPGARFGYFAIILALCNVTAQAFCQLLAVVVPSQQAAVALFPISLFFFILFSSFLIRIPTLPEYLRSWAPAASFSRWAFEGLVINEFKGNDALFPPPPGSGLAPDEIYRLLLGGFGFNGHGKWQAVPVLLANLLVFRVLGFFALHFFDFGAA